MIVGCKRQPSFEDLLGPWAKRYRLEALLAAELPEGHVDLSASASSDGVVTPAAAAAAAVAAAANEAAAWPAVSHGERRLTLAHAEEPAEKRLRLGLDVRSGPDCVDSDGTAASGPQAPDVRQWAEAVVGQLHGCPSVEEAAHRCERALTEFGAQVRGAAFREASPQQEPEPAPDPCEGPDAASEASQGMPASRVLMRAVYHLAERCKRLESSNDEVAGLRRALAEAQEAQRRLAHSNEVLQGHLRVSLSGGPLGPQAWTGGV